ncbi:MAG: hypothetical protein AMK70_15005 [Nitrospira bacterium SG8_35_1]|nr:MAG: hypothetical protein AMK70_15005 [Nitrospira bacterium SG8_35_1]
MEIKILSPHIEQAIYEGYFDDVSIKGACLQFEDKFGRVMVGELTESKMRVSIKMPDGEKIIIISKVRWVKKDIPQKLHFTIGVEFENIEDWQLAAVKKLVSIKDKDHNMMWSLWDNYQKQI